MNKRIKKWTKALGQSCDLQAEGHEKQKKEETVPTSFCPFGSWHQWAECRKLLYSKKFEEVQEGFRLVDRWKRTAGTATILVDVTTGLLRARLFDESGTAPHVDIVCMVYSMAILRMVNVTTDNHPVHENREGRTSVKQRALAVGLPIELVTLRHNATHKALPSLQELRFCCSLALTYMWESYWTPQHNLIHSVLSRPPAPKDPSSRNESVVPSVSALCAAYGIPPESLKGGDIGNVVATEQNKSIDSVEEQAPENWYVPATWTRIAFI